MSAVAKRLHPRRIRRTLGAASCVREPGRFVWRELVGAPAVGRYRLRSSGLVAHVRQPLLDMWVLEEVFRFRVYEPPREVAAGLAHLGRPIQVLDLGGHVGFFGLLIRSVLPDAQLVSVEPDPGNAELLRRTIEANGLQDRWRSLEACVGTSPGHAELRSSFHLSRVASGADDALERFHRGIEWAFPFLHDAPLLTVEQRGVTQLDAFPLMDGADLIKIDIEGSEWPILADSRFADLAAPALVLEYHPAYLDGDAEPTVLGAIQASGYRVCRHVHNADAGLIWAWKGP